MSSEIVITLQQPAFASTALELTLLIGGLAESLRLQPKGGRPISLRMVADDTVSKARVDRVADGAATFTLGRNQAEFLQTVLLRAYRDQVAEVNHVHIHGEHDGTPFDLTIMFGAFREPMSAEDAEKLLGD